MRFFKKLKPGIAAVALCLLFATPVAALDLVRKLTELDQVPPPVASSVAPTDPNMLFYLQRSTSANTIVYAAKLAKPGQIDSKNPLEIFWRRYEQKGERRDLNFIERRLVYGANPKAVAGRPNEYDAHIVSLPEIKFRMGVDEAGKPEAIIQMGDRQARLVFAYAQLDESGFVPKLVYLDIYGIDKATGRVLHEHLVPG